MQVTTTMRLAGALGSAPAPPWRRAAATIRCSELPDAEAGASRAGPNGAQLT